MEDKKPTYEEWVSQNPLTPEEEKKLTIILDENMKTFKEYVQEDNAKDSIELLAQIRKRLEMMTRTYIVETRDIIKR
jgi:hypothetical protein